MRCSASVRAGFLGGALASVGCLPRGSAPDDSAGVLQRTPAFVQLDRECDQASGTWLVRAEADAWSGGLVTVWTVDGSVVERHRFNAVESAPDGTWDRLQGELRIVDDWREATPNSSTAFRCTQAPSMLAWLEDLDGADVDCELIGQTSAFQDVPGATVCP